MASSSTIDPRFIEIGGRPLVPNNTQLSDEFSAPLDRDWAKNAFLIPDDSFGKDIDDPATWFDIKNRYWSTADAKFTDSRIGCNIGINARPQYTRYSDIRHTGKRTDIKEVSPTATVGPFGIGRFNSESLDDPSHTIYLRMGVPQFNSLTSFVRTAFDAEMVSMARSGKASSVFFNIGKAIGTITVSVAFPAVAAVVMGGRLLSWLFSRPMSKFYTLKPAMGQYWSMVQSLVNNIAIGLGIFPKILNESADTGQHLGQPYKLDQDHLDALSKMMPDIFRGQNYFNVYGIANRAQRMANKIFMQDYEKLNNGTATDYEGYLYKQLTGSGAHTTDISNINSEPTLMASIAHMAKNGFWYYVSQAGESLIERSPNAQETDKDGNNVPNPNQTEEQKAGFFDYFDSEFSDGTQFAIFKTDDPGSTSASFSSATGESDLANKVNGMVSQVRQARFTFADGNILGSVVDNVISGASDVLAGGLSGVTFGFSDIINGLVKGGYMDVPKVWQSSSATLPKASYSVTLISPYGNVMSQMMNIYIPLAMLMCIGLPRSVGKQGYESPFLCQIYDRGRQQIKLGMMESLTIKHGTSNLGFTTKGRPLAIDVDFTIVDMSTIMHMPLSTGELFSGNTALDEDNVLVDYIATLTGQDLYSQLYAMPKAKMRLAGLIMETQKLASPAYWANMVHESMTVGAINDLTLGASGAVAGILEATQRGSSMLKGNALGR